jgi:hypothetical protein
MQHIRPIQRKRAVVVAFQVPQAVPRDAVGIVADLAAAMRAPAPVHARPTEWTPPSEAEFLAEKTLHPGEREAYLARCESWYAAHPQHVRVLRPPAEPVDTELVAELFMKYKTVLAPLAKRAATWRAAGYSDGKVRKALAYYKRMEDTSDERQAALDSIFARWPAASKPTPKPKKVIKAVKKKLI